MKRFIIGAIIICTLLLCAGCPTADQSARDVLAAATGTIQQAQSDYKQECTASPSEPKCVLINQAIAGQNAAITALEAYCGFVPNVTLPTATCVPVKSAVGALNAAIANLKNFTGEIAAILGNKSQSSARDREATILASVPSVPSYDDIDRLRIGGAL